MRRNEREGKKIFQSPKNEELPRYPGTARKGGDGRNGSQFRMPKTLVQRLPREESFHGSSPVVLLVSSDGVDYRSK